VPRQCRSFTHTDSGNSGGPSGVAIHTLQPWCRTDAITCLSNRLTHVGPVSDSVGGLSVSLDAEVSSLTFRMGDGHTISCPGSGQKWTTAVQPAAKSPSCGYSYAKPSLPDGNYTVAAIANWAVTWTSNGQSGVINVPAVDTTELPVGELQVLVR
jgi:hypothetical protein